MLKREIGRLALEFEVLVGEILVNHGYDVTLNHRTPASEPFRVREIDILARNDKENILMPVEVKFYTLGGVTLSRLRDAASYTSNLREFSHKSKPLLVC
ncbi:PDDEXK family nuclease, partial [Elstera litoralis]|uniref:hypothetical protein n=1 Tax=Elstera litoralis TaxID=552518 RepID=UPI0012ED7510